MSHHWVFFLPNPFLILPDVAGLWSSNGLTVALIRVILRCDGLMANCDDCYLRIWQIITIHSYRLTPYSYSRPEKGALTTTAKDVSVAVISDENN